MLKITKWAGVLYLGCLYGTWFESAGGIASINRILGLLLVATWLLSLLKKRSFRTPHRFHAAFLLYIAWVLLSIFWAMDQDEAAFTAFRCVQLFGMTVIIWDLFRTKEDVTIASRVVIIAAYIPIVRVLYYYHTGEQGTQDYGRYTAGHFDPDAFGIILAIMIPIAWGLAISKEKQPAWFRFLCYAYPLAAS